MFDSMCEMLRDLIHDAFDSTFRSIPVQHTDDGLAIQIGDALYGISIVKV